MAGAALGAPQPRLAWQAQHLQHLQLVFRGKCSTWSTSGSFCVAGAALEASQLRIARHFFRSQTIHTTPSTLRHQTQHHQHTHIIYTTSSTQHHQHNLTNTSPSTQHHLHNSINTTPSTQHHLHYTIKHWQVQHLEHCHITPSASFLLIPLLYPGWNFDYKTWDLGPM